MRAVLSFSVKTRADMIELGRTFSEAFLAPHDDEPAARPNEARVVSLLGAIESGKTTFKQAAILPLAEKEYALTEDDWVPGGRYGSRLLGVRVFGNSLVRIADLGAKTYPFWFTRLFGPRQAIATDAGLTVRMKRGPGFDLIEHPSYLHLLRSDFVAFFAPLRRKRRSKRYFEEMKAAYLAAETNLCTPPQSRLVEKLSDALDLFEATAKQAEGTAQRKERLVSFLFPHATKEIEQAQPAFLEEAKRRGLRPVSLIP